MISNEVRLYELDVTEIALARYVVAAKSEEDARARLKRGEWEQFRDLGHEDAQVVDVRVLR